MKPHLLAAVLILLCTVPAGAQQQDTTIIITGRNPAPVQLDVSRLDSLNIRLEFDASYSPQDGADAAIAESQPPVWWGMAKDVAWLGMGVATLVVIWKKNFQTNVAIDDRDTFNAGDVNVSTDVPPHDHPHDHPGGHNRDQGGKP